MSKFRIEPMVCPQCEQRDTLRLWEEINAKEDVTAKSRLLDGSLFEYRCKKCGYSTGVAYNCIYKDDEKHFIVYFAADGDNEGMKAAMDRIEEDANKMAVAGLKYNVRRRIVNDANTMREKVIIFEAGLDDRIIELMKILYVSAIRENRPEIAVVGCFFCIVDGQWRMEMLTADGRAFGLDVQRELYGEFEKEYEALLSENRTYCVDAKYAIDLYNKNLDCAAD